ncbi:MAG: V-type ATPase subunit [Coriobacteriia bacterium]|nr:V-type ATPase subunit [Coriobacteriia bacterium]
MYGLAGIGDDIRYGYAVGRVRVLEGRLLSRATFERLLDAPDLREQKRILAETHMGRYIEDAETAADVEQALNASLADLYAEFLERADLPPAVVTFFQMPYDYANLRAALKARILGVGAGELSPLGSVPAEAFAGDGAELPDAMRNLLTMFDDAEEPPALDDVEALVDRAMFVALADAARASKVRFLRGLATLRIDLANARLLIRARAKGLRSAEVVSRLVPGGSKALVKLASGLTGMAPADLAAAIVDTRVLGGPNETELVDIERFDMMADSLVAERMLAARRSPGGAEPVLAYVLGREAEVLLLRTAVVGRLAGLDRESVRARLKERMS